MEPPDKRQSELVDLVKSWIPWRSEPANVSRDFWMPDHSCRVCYECDSQFTVFNRRHHCRLCGLVFCAKCTGNSVPVQSDDSKTGRDEGDRIRVCNYCFKRWEQDIVTTDKGLQVSSPTLSPSLSTISLASTKSSGTGNSTTTTAGSASQSTGANQRAPYRSLPSPSQSVQIEACNDRQEMMISGRNMDTIMDIGDPSPNQFGFCMNRSDDEDDDYGVCRSDAERQNCQHSIHYYGPLDYDELTQQHQLNKVYPSEEIMDVKDICPSVHDNTELSASSGVDKSPEEAGSSNSYEIDPSSTIYHIEGPDAEPVDFENNGLLWLPPEPEDEEDEREAMVFDEEEEDASGEWGYLRTSNSFGGGEYRSRDRSTEEHKKAMKNVVDGHFRALVAQLLQVENLPVDEDNDRESWLEIITSLSWEAASLLKPDTSKGGGMDPGLYVKIKCIACGHRSESMVVKGVVCKKNVANRRMTFRIEKARLLILGGALEYQRVANSLSSFDTLLQQEMDHLKMAVAKIDAHHPNVLLVEKSVSRYAQEYLLAKNISLVLNMKRPLLERIARCTGAQIVPSIDTLSSPRLGFCDLFHVEKYFEEYGSAAQGGKKILKTLMFFDGCPKPLGCTILLKGASEDELKKVKHVIQYGVFAAYHLALETSFLADEGATLPELPLKSPITVALPDKPSGTDKSISIIPGFTMPDAGRPHLNNGGKPDVTLLSKNRKLEVTSHNSDSGLVQSFPTIMRQTHDLNGFPMEQNKQAKHAIVPQICAPVSSISSNGLLSNTSPDCPPCCATKEKFSVCFVEHPDGGTVSIGQTIKGDHINPVKCIDSLGTLENGCIVADEMIVKPPGSLDLGTSYLDGEHRDDQTLSKEEFPPSPSDHQSILVSLSTRCVWKGTVCERAHLFRIKYYGSFDKPLGRYLRDHLFDESNRCHSCGMPSEAHVHCYTHRQGSLTISVRKLPELLLPGKQDGKIWMWHRCLRCPRVNGFPPATRRIVMSDAAWGLSFGKFLELSFSNHAAASRVATCGHSLHRDCLRFYGFGPMVACFRYASISVHSVYLPPSKLDFNYQHQDWIQKEADEVSDRAELLFTEVLNALRQIAESSLNTGSLTGASVKVLESRRHIAELEGILQMEKGEFDETFQKIVRKEAKKRQPIIDILDINKLRRQLIFQSYLWDQRLVLAADSQNRPHDVLSGCMIRHKGSVDKLVDLNLASKPPLRSFHSLESVTSGSRTDEPLEGGTYPTDDQEVLQHPNQSVDQQRRDVGHDCSHGEQGNTNLYTSSTTEKLDPLVTGPAIRRAVSDGQFPTMANLSDTLDAKWRGETSPALPDTVILNSSVSADATTSVSDRLAEHTGADGTQSAAYVLPVRMADNQEDFSSLIHMPFQKFYHSVSKNWSSSKIEALAEYNPAYVSSFRDLERQNGARLLLPNCLNDTVIPIYDDEPTSIISFALVSADYHTQMSDERDILRDAVDSIHSLSAYDSANSSLFQSVDKSESFKSLGSIDESLLSMSSSRSSSVLDPLAYTTAMHVRVSFSDEGPLGKVKYTVTCYYAKRFDALRRTCCPFEQDFVRSLSRCKKWGAQGGKSNVFFAKSLDDRFIIKQVTKTELESFFKFAPEYFKYLSESIGSGSPTCLAKILGIYQVTSRHLKGGKESKMDVLVMENLLFGRNVTRLYDLKGSARSRYNPDSSGNNKVLLDQNLIEAMPTSPIFVGNKAKRLLERAVWNDTSFLASIDVMDYSLLVGVDEEKHELVLGIIDFMRQYTWDKHLETWVKAAGILGGPKNEAPTVISPKQYKKRFRKAIPSYFLMVPDQWSPATIIPSRSQSDLTEDNQKGSSEP